MHSWSVNLSVFSVIQHFTTEKDEKVQLFNHDFI